jgi:hypothetical protein
MRIGLTNPYRVFFREVRVPPPEGFHEILRMHLPAKISVGSGVTIWPQPVKDIYNNIECKFPVGNLSLSALDFLSKETFFFPTDPQLDPLERMVTPGAGESFRNEMIDEAKISDTGQRHVCHRVLENYVIPAHEAKGHVEINLSAEKSSFECKSIWLQLMNCVKFPNINDFLDFPDHAAEDMLFQHYLVAPVHELYALLKEESVWKKLSENPKFETYTTKLKQSVRAKQDNLPVKLLQFLIEKSGNDLVKVQKIIDECVLKADLSLSHFMPDFLRDLARGVEIDNILDFAFEQTAKKCSKQYSPAKLAIAIEEQHQYAKEYRSHPAMKAVLSTYMSLSYSDSRLDISFYSQGEGENAVKAIPNLVALREAKKILDRQGNPYPISLLPSMEPIRIEMLEQIAYGRFRDEYPGPLHNFDALEDFGKFYRTWRPALLEAQKRVQGGTNNANANS